MLERLFGSRLRAKILGWLFSHPDERFYVRQLESLLAEDSTNLSRELQRLTRLGILLQRTEGRQKFSSANPSCPLFTELRGLALKTSGVAGVLRDALTPLAKTIDVAFIYGSLARGEETSESDVDLMVVGRATFGDVVAATKASQKKIGREINPSVYPSSEFRMKFREGHHLLNSILKAPKVFLIGDERELGSLAEKRVAQKAQNQPARSR